MIRPLIVLLLTATALLSAGEPAAARIATVSLDRVTNLVGYENLAVIFAEKEAKEAMKAVKAKIRELNARIFDAMDEEAIRGISNELSLMERKREIIMRGGRQRDNFKDKLTQFIDANFRAEYALILNAQGGGSLDNLVISSGARLEDITTRVVEKLQAEL